jgi:hypothetical protein
MKKHRILLVFEKGRIQAVCHDCPFRSSRPKVSGGAILALRVAAAAHRATKAW